MAYNTLLTTAGREKIALSLSGGNPAAIKFMAFGDSEHEPTGFETSLVHEVHRTEISSLTIDPNNPSWAIVEAIIPTNIGGFYIKEVGVFDSKGVMFAIANFPPVYKPLLSEGVGRDLKVKLYLEVGGKQNVNLILRDCCGNDTPYVDGCNQSYPDIDALTAFNKKTALYLNSLNPVNNGNCIQGDCISLVDSLSAYNTNISSYLNSLEPCKPSTPINQLPTTPNYTTPTPTPTTPTAIPTSLVLVSQNYSRYKVLVDDNGSLITEKELSGVIDVTSNLIIASPNLTNFNVSVDNDGTLITSVDKTGSLNISSNLAITSPNLTRYKFLVADDGSLITKNISGSFSIPMLSASQKATLFEEIPLLDISDVITNESLNIQATILNNKIKLLSELLGIFKL